MSLIFSMAKNLAFIFTELHNGNEVRLEHLTKLFFYREADYEKMGWVRSVRSATYYVSRTKLNGGFPKKSFIWDAIWGGGYDDHMDSWTVSVIVSSVSELIREYAPPALPLNDAEMSSFVGFLREYHDWLASALHTKGSVGPRDCFDEIEFLLDKYPYKKRVSWSKL